MWLNGTGSKECCEFKGGPFLEPKYFGDGIAIAVAKGDWQLRAELNQAVRTPARQRPLRGAGAALFPLSRVLSSGTAARAAVAALLIAIFLVTFAITVAE